MSNKKHKITMEELLEKKVAEHMRMHMTDIKRKKKPTLPIFKSYSFLYE